LKSQSSRLAIEQKKAKAEQAAKGAQTQTESHKEMLTNLQSALKLKIARKTALETELKNLSAEIVKGSRQYGLERGGGVNRPAHKI
jgi:hypothetical protein